MKKILFCLTAFAALFFSSCVKEDINVFGGITGIVKDAQNSNPLEGVKVTITYTGASQITTSDGQFMFDNLEAIEYTLSFEKSGYLPSTQTVKVQAGETATVHVQMHRNLLGIEVTPSFLDFSTNETSLNLTLQSVSGQSVMFNASTSDSWLSVSPQSGSVSISGSTTVRVMVSRTSAPGNYEGVVTIRVNSESMTIPVYMRIAGSTQPVVTIESIADITQTTATVNGLLTLEDGVQVSDYGICYSTQANPTISNQKASRGGSTRSTTFSCQISGLTAGTEYFVRAYAIADGVTYYSNSRSFTTTSSSGGGGSGTEDYSSAQLLCSCDELAIGLLSCKRLPSGRIQMETTIKNISVENYTDYRVPGVGSGQNWDGRTWTTEILDDFGTDYNIYSLKMSLNGQEGNSITTSVPLGATKRFTFTIQDVPVDATKISLHIASMFYAYPCVYAYLQYNNVPIY